MFSVNLLGNIDPLSIYIARPSGEPLGCLDNEIDFGTANITLNLNNFYELSFEMKKSENQNDSWYDYVQEGMYLLVEKIGLFKVNSPEDTIMGDVYTKSITATSCNIELDDKNTYISINMGTKTSQEYLLSDNVNDNGEIHYTYENDDYFELIVDPYKGVPIDWIVLKNLFAEQLEDFLSKYLTLHFGNLDIVQDNVTYDYTCTITDSDAIAEFKAMADLVPRMQTEYIKNFNDEYEPVFYFQYTYDNNGNVTQIDVYTGFIGRIERLVEFYTIYGNQLSLLDLVLDGTGSGWQIGNIYGVSSGDYSLANRKAQFELDGDGIYAFLSTTLAQYLECLIEYDIFDRKINITPVEYIGEDTGIVMSYDNLINSLGVSAEDEDFATRLKVTGADDIDITRVNFGSEYIEDLSYKMNAKDSQGKRIYVKDALAAKYSGFIAYRDGERENYINYSKQYDRLQTQINEIKYRVPNDDLKNDWSTFSMDDLEQYLIAYTNSLNALIVLYKEDYGKESGALNQDDSVNESYMKHTEYWYDYVAYKNLIEEVNCAISTFPYYSDEEKWTELNKSLYKAKIKEWETEWSLFGSVELKNKTSIYKTEMELLAEKSVIMVVSNKTYNWEDLSSSQKSSYYNAAQRSILVDGVNKCFNKSWSNLSSEEKAPYQSVWDSFTSTEKATYNNSISNYYNNIIGEHFYNFGIKFWNTNTLTYNSAFDLTDNERLLFGNISTNYYFDVYLEHYKNYCSAQAELVNLQQQIAELETELKIVQDNRKNIVANVQIENYTINGNRGFTDSEIQTIYRLYKDADYSNENFLVTNITTSDEQIDILKELLEDGQNKLSENSRPQLNFKLELDNLLGLPEYKSFWEDFKNGNYMYIEYKDNIYVKLRMVSYTFNPLLPTSQDFSITFSSYIRSKTGVTDVESLLGNEKGGSSRSSSSSGGSGSGDNLGEIDGIDITISNTMLGKLLSTELFGSRVTNIILDTVKLNSLTSQSATFQGLASGTTIIDGGCISTGSIQSNNYNQTNKTGSILRLNDGTFSFGGEKLVWNGTSLEVSGKVTATTLSTGNRTSSSTGTNGIFIDASGNLYGGANNETIIRADGTISFGNGKINYNGSTLSVNGAITASSGSIGHWDIENNGMYLRGTSIESDKISYICSLTKKKAAYGWGQYQDKYDFTVHNSSSEPYFHYYVRQVGFDNEIHYMLMEEADNQNISTTSGAVDTVRVYSSQYQGTPILLGEVLSTNHSTDLPIGAYCVIETQESVSAEKRILKGQVRPIEEAISTNNIRIAVMNAKTTFADDLGDDGDFYEPLYDTAQSDDGDKNNVYIPEGADKNYNVLLSYEVESSVSGYTYLNSQSLNHSIVPIMAIDVKLVSGSPDFNTAKTILYNNGKIKAGDVECSTVSAESIIASSIESLAFDSDNITTGIITANKFVAGDGNEMTITDANYTNITLRHYVENILRTNRLM